MDYEKKYKEALERASKLRVQNPFDTVSQMMEHVFPELKESEDERIRKVLIDLVKSKEEDGYMVINNFSTGSILAWLEKQSESDETKAKIFLINNGYPIDANGVFPTYEEIYNIIKEGLEHQGEKSQGKSALEAIKEEKTDNQNCIKSADKIEPKFKVGDTMRTLQEANFGYTDGMPVVISIDNEYYHCTNELIAIKDQDDYEFPPINVKQKSIVNVEPKFNFSVGHWIVATGKCVYLIAKIDGFNVTLVDTIGNEYVFDVSSLADAHLWTLRDAEEGDVLCYKGEVFLYKHDIKDWKETSFGGMVYYCCYDGKRFITDSFYSLTEQDKIDIHPATKEQCDLLFSKMREAGWEWSKEKKELKKSEQKPYGQRKECLDCQFNYAGECKGYCTMKKSEQKPAWSEEDEKMLNHTEQEWKQEKTGDLTDFEHAMMDIGKSFFGQHAGLDPNDTDAIKEQANLLLELVPSKEWGEEDNKRIKRIYDFLWKHKRGYSAVIWQIEEDANWLKSLKPQNTWKPSEEQIRAIRLARSFVVELEEQLQKIKENKL